MKKTIVLMAAVNAIISAGSDHIPARSTVLSEQWFFTRDVKAGNLTKIPAKCKTFRLDADHGINLDAVEGKKGKTKDACIVYNQFVLKDAQELYFGAGADWWMDVYLNGEQIFSSGPMGNTTAGFSADNHLFSGKGRKGKNLLAVVIRRGGCTWSFFLKEKSIHAFYPSTPVIITADPGSIQGKIKPMNAVNNGPVKGSRGRSTMAYWKAAAIPFARNHDAAFSSAYGGEHTVDVHAIFPDFTKDVNDPASYHFPETDRYLQTIMEAGTKVFYRLGSKIEHAPEKYGTKVPPDFQKWAEICEHIIRHYNEGWANGFKMNIEYWEIWNEPDLGRNKNGSPTWQGTKEQFFELYRVTALHLKKCFPKLKIGAPGLAFDLDWTKDFLTVLTSSKKRVPLDFFSWHCYGINADIYGSAAKFRRVLDEFGYRKTESILDEWNYIRGWTGDTFVYSIRTITGLKGAAFSAAVMCSGQNAPVDMLMYYDARPCEFNGLFDNYTYAPLKTYYSFLAWAKLSALGKQIRIDTQGKNGIYSVGATDGKKTGVLISRYFEPDKLPDDLPVTFTLKNGDLRGVRVYLIDQDHDLTEIPYRMDSKGNLLFTMKANTVVYIETPDPETELTSKKQ